MKTMVIDSNERLFSDRQLIKLCVPLIVEQALNVLVGMVDVLMVAAIGETAVSGVSLVDTVNILLTQVLAALATGGAVVCSQMLGSGDEKGGKRASGQVLLLTLAITVLISIISLVFNRHILKLLFGVVESDVMRNAVIYFRLTALSYPFLAMYNSGAALFRSMGNSGISMRYSMLMNTINVAGNAICIFLLGMGVEGVAIPTLLARAIAAIMILSKLRAPQLPLGVNCFEQLRPERDTIRRILQIGVPNGIENGMFQFGKVLLSGLVATLGTASIAGYAVAGNLVTFLYLPGNALGLGLLTVTGKCVGAGRYRESRFYTKRFIMANYAILLVLATTLCIGRYFFAGIYGLSAESKTIAASLLLIHCCGMVIWPIAFLLPYALRASNDAAFTMKVSAFVMWVFRVGLAYVFIKILKMPVEGVWYAMMIDWVVRVIIYPRRYAGTEKRLEKNYGKTA